MNEPAPAAPAPMAPPAPPAPPAPAAFAPPADPATALDVTAPLQMQAPAHPAAAPAMPPAPPAPGMPPAPQPHAVPAGQVVPSAPSFADGAAQAAVPAAPDHPTSLAMPQQALHGAPVQAMPAGYDQAPAAIGGVAAASPEDLADRAAAMPLDDEAPAAAGPAGATPPWAQPAHALVLAMFALTWQLLAFYDRVILPNVLTSGADTVQLDNVLNTLPLHTTGASVIGMALGFATVVLVLLGVRAGVREPVLQAVTGVLGGVALAATVLLPALVG